MMRSPYFDFEVTLKDVKPKIRRRFLIAEKATFLHLHEAIQDACGWTNSHLFAFRDARGRAIAGLPDNESDEPDPDASRIKIASLFGPNNAKECSYDYDFGDGWEHEVVFKGIVLDPERFGRRLLGGARAFPPDDCGGIPGYEECVEVATGKRKDKERLEWLGGWQPEEFDLKKTARLYYQQKLVPQAHYEENL